MLVGRSTMAMPCGGTSPGGVGGPPGITYAKTIFVPSGDHLACCTERSGGVISCPLPTDGGSTVRGNTQMRRKGLYKSSGVRMVSYAMAFPDGDHHGARPWIPSTSSGALVPFWTQIWFQFW